MLPGVENELSHSEKQAVLDRLLASPAFGRSEQLRTMLRYMATEEIAGRGAELSEYSIGVHGLSRPEDYRPEIDSTVRSRAHELRKRLDAHYQSDGAKQPWRVELPKGSYRPRFVRATEVGTESPTAALPFLGLATENTDNTAHLEKPKVEFQPKPFLLGILACALVLGLGAATWTFWPATAAERAITEIWGPMLHPGGTVTVMLPTVPQLWVREFDENPLPIEDPPYFLPAPDAPAFLAWYNRFGLQPPKNIALHPNSHSPLGGEATAAITMAAFLGGRKVLVETIPGNRMGAPEIRERNAVVLGRVEYAKAVSQLQPPSGYSIRYSTPERRIGVISADGKERLFRENRGSTNYGLITVLTRATDQGPLRTMLICGINSDGSHAASEFMTSGVQLEKLAARLRQDFGRVPDNYQAIVRTRSAETRVLWSELAIVKKLP